MSDVNSTAVSDPREERGLRIASRHRLKPTGGIWHVPSESSGQRYRVDPEAGQCSCPDNEVRRVKCKHLWAVEITMWRETTRTVETTRHADGSTTTRETTRTVKTAKHLVKSRARFSGRLPSW